MTEADELISDLKAVYGELVPGINPDQLRIPDGVVALGVLLRREIELATLRLTKRVALLERALLLKEDE